MPSFRQLQLVVKGRPPLLLFSADLSAAAHGIIQVESFRHPSFADISIGFLRVNDGCKSGVHGQPWSIFAREDGVIFLQTS